MLLIYCDVIDTTTNFFLAGKVHTEGTLRQVIKEKEKIPPEAGAQMAHTGV